MTGFADAVRTKVAASCLVDGDGIAKGGCRVSLTDAPSPHVIIDLDEARSPAGPTRAKCDFLFFANPDLVAPIEIKDSGTPNVAKAAKQLQAGGKSAIEVAPRGRAVRFMPVLVSRKLRRDERAALRKVSIRFQNQEPVPVRHLICGMPLAEVLEHE